MSGRDLLYKPQVPHPLQDEGTDQKSKAKGVRARDLGGVGDIVPTPVKRPAGAEPRKRTEAPKAYKAAYFNQDTSGVRAMNPNQSSAKALRGASEATDLRKIVLPPPPSGIETPDPGVLSSASDMMGLEDLEGFSLESLLARQSAFTQSEGITVEILEMRIQQLEAMTRARRTALGRMREAALQNATIHQAYHANGKGVEQAEDLAAAGTELVQRTSDQADGMHRRIAKALGIKPPK